MSSKKTGYGDIAAFIGTRKHHAIIRTLRSHDVQHSLSIMAFDYLIIGGLDHCRSQHHLAWFRYIFSKEYENTTSNKKDMLVKSRLFTVTTQIPNLGFFLFLLN